MPNPTDRRPPNSASTGNDNLDRYLESVKELERVSKGEPVPSRRTEDQTTPTRRTNE
jgi:hypothetical protein